MALEKEISSTGEDMSSVDEDYENNEPDEMNEPLIFDMKPEPLILDKEYDLDNNKNSNNSNNDEMQTQVSSLIKKKETIKVNVRQETLKIEDIVKEQEKEIKSLYEEKMNLNQNMLDFQKNKNQLQYDIIQQQKELIKKTKKK